LSLSFLLEADLNAMALINLAYIGLEARRCELVLKRGRLCKQAKRTMSYFCARNKIPPEMHWGQAEIRDTRISRDAFKPYSNLDGKRMCIDKVGRRVGDEMKGGRKRRGMKRNCNNNHKCRHEFLCDRTVLSDVSFKV
jgi:hypothetical protein